MQEERYTEWRIRDLGKGYLSLSPCTGGNESCDRPETERRVAARCIAHYRRRDRSSSGVVRRRKEWKSREGPE
jgi:hypothetical protein